jgi:KaiC/GvpD/RAD55 family RecA-like ATPase
MKFWPAYRGDSYMMEQSVSREEIEIARKDSAKSHFFTTFDFLRAHYGVRKGCYSVIMGTSGCGKSGLAKAIAVQSANQKGTSVLVLLTEESPEKYASSVYAYADASGVSTDNIKFYDMKKIPKCKTHEEYLTYVREIIAGSFADIVILDNLTTDQLYSSNTAINDQVKSVWFLKSLSQNLNIAIVAVCHTAAHVTDNMGRLFNTDDHKGSKSLGMEASYFYALQKFTAGENTYVFLRTLKHRDHPEGYGTYLLKYDKGLGVYVGDKKVDFQTMNDIFKKRDQLGKL